MKNSTFRVLSGIDFMRHFPSSFSYLYILLAIDYVSKWDEAIPTRTNDATMVSRFLKKNIFFADLESRMPSLVTKARISATLPSKLS